MLKLDFCLQRSNQNQLGLSFGARLMNTALLAQDGIQNKILLQWGLAVVQELWEVRLHQTWPNRVGCFDS